MSESARANRTILPNAAVRFRVRLERDGILVLEKPAGVVTQPGVGHEHDTILNGLFATHGNVLQNLGRERDFGLVHRLDRDTSGLLVVATTAECYDGLRAAFAERRVAKYYWAICHKPPRDPTGVIRKPISEVLRTASKYTSTRTARVGGPDARPALTAYRVVTANELAALVEARPVTGRLHQVRVHLASVGAAILGDDVYGPRISREATRRVALHAHRLVFEHPLTGEPIDLEMPMPKEMRRLCSRLGLVRPTAAAADEERPEDAQEQDAELE